jgi:hypothetical protein
MPTNLGGGVAERDCAAEELNGGVPAVVKRGHGGEVLISASREGGRENGNVRLVRAGRRRGGSEGDRSPTNNCAWMREQKV